MIWVVFTIMIATAVAFTIWPIIRKGRYNAGVTDGTSAVLVDQLDEIQRDFDRGLVSEDEASASRLEIKRRILAVSHRAADVAIRPNGEGRTAILLAAILIPLFALGFYTYSGAPGVPSIAFADRQSERAQEAEIADLTKQLFDKLINDPTGGPSEGWMLLGQTYMRMGNSEAAIKAFETVTSREDATSATWSMLAEALIRFDEGIVTPQADAAIARSLEIDALNPAAIFFKATSLSQSGELASAHDLLVSRLNDSNGFEPWMELYVVEANRLGEQLDRTPLKLADIAPAAPPGPTEADIAAAGDMSPEDRSAFIRSMVDRLAAKLVDAPNDLDGWIRLANAYSVLGERENAILAYEKARMLLQDMPMNDPRHVQVERALLELEK